jgi:hypothetical protein
MWSQIVGKVRLGLAAPMNHWWHVPLYVSARGLTTSPIPYAGRLFEVEFDLRGASRGMDAASKTTAAKPKAPTSRLLGPDLQPAPCWSLRRWSSSLS